MLEDKFSSPNAVVEALGAIRPMWQAKHTSTEAEGLGYLLHSQGIAGR